MSVASSLTAGAASLGASIGSGISGLFTRRKASPSVSSPPTPVTPPPVGALELKDMSLDRPLVEASSSSHHSSRSRSSSYSKASTPAHSRNTSEVPNMQAQSQQEQQQQQQGCTPTSKPTAQHRQGLESIVLALRFKPLMSVQEPAKKSLVAYEKDHSKVPKRQAFCILQPPLAADHQGPGGVVEYITKRAVDPSSHSQLEGVNALATPDDCFEAEAIAKADPEVIRLCGERYGISDMSLVACDPWSVHACPIDARIIQCFMYMRSSPNDNMYAHPLDMTPLVDMSKGKVVRIDLPYKEAIPWNRVDNNYHTSFIDPASTRQDIAPLNITQPDGPSFTVDGTHIRWQKWDLRATFNYREGLVLHNLNYNDAGNVRPVAHRLSLVEMAVPYGDPRWAAGEPVKLPKAVCMHEEDIGLMYKHVDYRTGHSEARRARRLVISFVSTVVNYEYAFYWYLYQDGTIGHEIKLTGELSTNMLSPGEGSDSEFGTMVGPGVNAQHHQHMFCARLDMAVDDHFGGEGLVVSEVDVEPIPADPVTNPYGNGFRAIETNLETVHHAKRVIAPERGRVWKFNNPSQINPITRSPVAYKLTPLSHPPLMANPDSLVAKKGHFATKNLWVTPHHDQQRFPSGEYVFGANDCTGLAVWTKEDAPLANADPVAWYCFGVTHLVRIEDFPIMPVEHCGFTLKPFGFFTANPAIDIPNTKDPASKMTVHPPPGDLACCSSA
ncbi:MAG: hypothetical protein WDW38_007870 [Sanguina aurantia]